MTIVLYSGLPRVSDSVYHIRLPVLPVLPSFDFIGTSFSVPLVPPKLYRRFRSRGQNLVLTLTNEVKITI